MITAAGKNKLTKEIEIMNKEQVVCGCFNITIADLEN